MLFFQISDYEYIIQINRKVSWDEFREKAKVYPETYAEIYARRIYSSAFEYSTDLVDEFKKYYRHEYKSFNEFLFWRYGISEIIINQISGAGKGYLSIFNFDFRIKDDENLKRSIEQLFRELEVKR